MNEGGADARSAAGQDSREIPLETESRRDRAQDHQGRDVHLKRAYEPRGRKDGRRVLVDRLWPRGISEAEAGIDEWLKELAPSTGLRKWFGHDADRWASSVAAMRRKSTSTPSSSRIFEQRRAKARLRLVYSARDELHNDAVVLRDVLLGRDSGWSAGE